MLAEANSLWTLLNFDTMKPAMPTKQHLSPYIIEPKLDMEYTSRKITVLDNGQVLEPVIIRKQHLDSNNHVNNGQYINIASDYLPEGFDTYQIRAEYKKQAHLGDVFLPYVVTEAEKIIVSLRDENGGVYMNAEFMARNGERK